VRSEAPTRPVCSMYVVFKTSRHVIPFEREERVKAKGPGRLPTLRPGPIAQSSSKFPQSV